jgi:hypothetical protein
MKRLITACVLLLIFKSPLLAQDPVAIFKKHSDSIPAEHIYVHTDKQAYVAGETIWFKTYLYKSGANSYTSTNLFVQLLNEKGDVKESKKYPIVVGKSLAGQLDIPASLAQGVYLIRAWTNYTRFLDPTYSFNKAIPVFNPGMATSQTMTEAGGYNFTWHPEGGKIINGVSNVMAFKCIDKKMQPVVVNGTLFNSKSENLGTFSTNKYGVGYFSYPPAKAEKYYAELQFPDNTKQKIELPQGEDKGVVLNIADHDEGKVFSLLTGPDDATAPKEALVIAVMNNIIVFKANIPIKDNLAQGLLNTAKLQEGILKFYAFDLNNQLLAQRACYITTDNSRLKPELKLNKKGAGIKELNEYSFNLPENVTGNFSVSVTDVDKELLLKNNENIINSLFFQAGRNQYADMQVKDEEVKDLLMLTGNWFDDDWKLYSGIKVPDLNGELHVPFKGKAYIQSSNKIITDGRLNILTKLKDSTENQYSTNLSSDGRFKFYGLIYEDTAKILYGWTGGKNSRPLNVELEIENDQTDYNSFLKNFKTASWFATKSDILNNPAAIALSDNLIKELRPDVLYKGRYLVKSPATEKETYHNGSTEEVNKRYTSGAFSNMTNSKIVDLINEPPANTSGNIFDYIQGKLSGFTIDKAGGNYAIYSSRSLSTMELLLNNNKRGQVPGKMYLDETETSSDAIARIPLNQIALVKYFPPGAIMVPGTGISCVLAVYTKKQRDMNTTNLNYSGSILFPGYQPSRIFYSPDYNQDDKKKKDTRTTIYWNPDIMLTDANEIRISFYNNDNAKKFHVVLEGITTDGKLISFEKIIE